MKYWCGPEVKSGHSSKGPLERGMQFKENKENTDKRQIFLCYIAKTIDPKPVDELGKD